jgi:putative glycosyltransferase (TIGR04372 family)
MMHVTIEKILRIPKALKGWWWAPELIVVLLLIKPAFRIRIGKVSYHRMGHFVVDSSILAIRQRHLLRRTRFWLFLPKETCNHAWRKLVLRHFLGGPWVGTLIKWCYYVPGGKSLFFTPPAEENGSRDTGGLFSNNAPVITVKGSEDKFGYDWLKKQGWREGNPIVTLLVRDDAYLSSEPSVANTVKAIKEGSASDFFLYHKYRDSRISEYRLAVEWLTDQGAWVLRMGKHVKDSLDLNKDRFIDYANTNDRSDFLDVWLFSRASLCISTGTGIDAVSDTHRVPLLYVNFLPLSNINSWNNALTVPKTLLWKDSGRPLTVDEHLDWALLKQQDYDRAGIEIVDLTPEEILEAVKERWARLQGTWTSRPEDERLRAAFWAKVCRHPKARCLHDYIHPDASPAAFWLRANADTSDV